MPWSRSVVCRNRRAGRVDVQAFGIRVPLEHLSDGYQSVVALATDMMISLLRQWPTVDAAEGTVLIDELGQIKEGYLADLLLVDGDPIANVRILQEHNRLLAIMKDGKFHKKPQMQEQRRRLIA